MPRAYTSSMAAGTHSHQSAELNTGTGYHLHGRQLTCVHCDHVLECVEQNRRAGSWLGSFICPNCRAEYFYAYRWGRLVRRS